MSELRLEHYKALKEEHRQYLYQVQKLWMFKLTTLGAVIATTVFHDKIVLIAEMDAKTIVATGLFALAVLAFIIDLKTLEVGLHVKLISDHIREKFTDVSEITDWETSVWSKHPLASFRTTLTIVAAVGMSLAIFVSAVRVIYILKPEWGILLIFSGVVLTALLGVAALKIFPALRK